MPSITGWLQDYGITTFMHLWLQRRLKRQLLNMHRRHSEPVKGPCINIGCTIKHLLGAHACAGATPLTWHNSTTVDTNTFQPQGVINRVVLTSFNGRFTADNLLLHKNLAQGVIVVKEYCRLTKQNQFNIDSLCCNDPIAVMYVSLVLV